MTVARIRPAPQADGFRNYQETVFAVSAEELLVDKAQLLTLSAPEMTVLVVGACHADDHGLRFAPLLKSTYPTALHCSDSGNGRVGRCGGKKGLLWAIMMVLLLGLSRAG